VEFELQFELGPKRRPSKVSPRKLAVLRVAQFPALNWPQTVCSAHSWHTQSTIRPERNADCLRQTVCRTQSAAHSLSQTDSRAAPLARPEAHISPDKTGPTLPQ